MATEYTETNGVITRQILKSKSGEFDIESIHTVSLNQLGLYDLGCISECTNLERLDLSQNDIIRLHKLAGLTSLTTLNLSANKITHLDGLQSLENLQNLNVSGNLIGSLDVLKCVSGLEKLTSVRLQDVQAGLSNPICETSYADKMLIMFPTLLNLDGKRVRGRGSELFQLCQYMDNALNNLPSIKQSSENTSKVPEALNVEKDVSLLVDSLGSKECITETESQLRELLGNCRLVCKEADNKFREEITAAKHRLQSDDDGS